MLLRPKTTQKIKPKRTRTTKEPEYDPALTIFSRLENFLPKLGIPLCDPVVFQNGCGVESERAGDHHYVFEMQVRGGTFTYGIRFASSYRPEPEFATKNAVAHANAEHFCFSVTLSSDACRKTDTDSLAGEINQRFTACVLAHAIAPQIVAEIDTLIALRIGKVSRRNPLTT